MSEYDAMMETVLRSRAALTDPAAVSFVSSVMMSRGIEKLFRRLLHK